MDKMKQRLLVSTGTAFFYLNGTGTVFADEPSELKAQVDGLKTQVDSFRESIEKLQNSYQDISKARDDISDINNKNDIFAYGIVAMGICLLAVIVVCIWLYNKVKNLQQQLQKKSSTKVVENLRERVDRYEQEIQSLSTSVEELREVVSAPEAPEAPEASSYSRVETMAGAPEPVRRPSEEEEFAAAYNEMAKTLGGSGLGGKSVKDNFIKEYNIRGFHCANHRERIERPELSPIFTDSSSPTATEATLWAARLQKGGYAVVPKAGEYGPHPHMEGALRDVFDSNYDNGGYKKVIVKRVAVFEEGWVLKRKGVLELSR